jgi:hypothetical protein
VIRAGGARRLAARLGRRPAVLVLVGCLALTGALYAAGHDARHDPRATHGDGTYRPILARGDGHLMFLMLRSMVLDGDLDFENDLARFGDPWKVEPAPKTGRKAIVFPIGPALVWAPVFAAAHGASWIANALGAEIPSHGYTHFHQRIVFATSPLFAVGAIALGWAVARRRIGGRFAPGYAAVAILFGTTLTYYATYMPSYAHAMEALTCAGFLGAWALTLGDGRRRRYVLLGVLLGVSALVRVTSFALGAVLVVEAAAAVLARGPAPRERLRLAAAWAGRGGTTLAVALVAFVPQLVAWRVLFGEWVTSPSGSGFLRLGEPEVVETLFSSRNGWLSTHPLAYAGVLGLLVVPRGARLVAAGFGVAVAGQVYLSACVLDWWAGASFGQRRLAGLTLVLVVGLAALLRAGGRLARRVPRPARHAAAALALGWFVAWNLSGMAALREGKAASSVPRPMCCDNVHPSLGRPARPVYERIGNPFALPASAIFAWRHGVPPKRWDRVVGHYADHPSLMDYRTGRYRTRPVRWNVASDNLAPFLVGGLGPRRQDGAVAYRETTAPRASFLLPLFLREDRRIQIPVRGAAIDLRVNGWPAAARDLGPGWETLEARVPREAWRRGPNVVEIRCPAGCAVGGLTLFYD